MTIQDVVGIISQVGFPIVVAGYCLITLNKTMAGLKEAVTELKDVIKEQEK